ncbi:RNA polymerase II C-terminal domain phosphatase-like 4 [Silene latifolia]|uniref:RNA polymerase II C-terminal domain phosphatase-like 4 n=1 Tax=Silene latifolia TaxID=37657 RepID=UPI003D770386
MAAIALQNQDCGYGANSSNYHQNQRVMRRIMKPRDPRPCPHLWILNDSCLNCGKKVQNHQLHAMPYSKFHKNTKVHLNKSFNVETKTIIKSPNKMCLVLDLDHTLLNSTPLDSLSLEENYLKNIRQTSQGVALKNGLYRLEHMGIMTKLRPCLRKFLDEASKMYEMYIYTMGDRPYALEMAKLLDPDNKYFNSRIISRDDCQLKHQKSLNAIQKPENTVLILDDTPSVWPNNKDNLIVMDRYMYFSLSYHKFGHNCKSLAELKRDEDESDGALSSVLQVLKRIHHDYYVDNAKTKEINAIHLLKEARRRVLRGCKLVFSGVVSKNCEASNHRWWKMAEELGATCVSEVESSVTHVVSVDGGTEKSRRGVEQGKFVVHPRWLEAAYYLWRRQLEHYFPVKHQLKINTPY